MINRIFKNIIKVANEDIKLYLVLPAEYTYIKNSMPAEPLPAQERLIPVGFSFLPYIILNIIPKVFLSICIKMNVRNDLCQ